ncbi:MAG: RHS repeat-associated core domain-containing protein, partial [Proteobacteria bacterium]|nr:RHS repeat-associated core domain-containing protein [Pseudomonadota bacterium]MCL2307686.1 RHS repeat-associated core domain-containing protein [Pseudomonadota bacterium]
TTFVLQDGQGSSRLTVDNDGAIKEVITYDAFGNRIDGFGHSATDATNLNHLYVGEVFDADSGFYHLRARDYDPVTGRFTARDEFEGLEKHPLTLNLYLYANADPINFIDPSGYFSLGGIMSGLGSMVTLSVRVVVIGGRTAVSAVRSIVSLLRFRMGGVPPNSWGFWKDLPKVMHNGKEYASVNGRLYTKHAVEHMTPKGFGNAAGRVAVEARGVPAMAVEEAIIMGVARKEGARTIYTLGNLQIVTEGLVGRIIVTVKRVGL